MPALAAVTSFTSALIAIQLAVIVGLVVMVWSLKRRRRARLQVGSDGELLPSLVSLSHGTLVSGNSVKLLENGDGYFGALFEELARARTTIHFETFLWKKGEISHRLAMELARRARDGLTVRVLLDGSGSRRADPRDLRAMCEAGCRVERFHRFRVENLGRINQRDHRKIAVFDGRIGLIGGHCIVDAWRGDARGPDEVRDLSVRVEGPVVAQLQAAFCEGWIEETGEVPAGEGAFPALESCGNVSAHLTYVNPQGKPSSLKLLHLLAIRSAREQLLIQSPYFLPDPDDVAALREAVQRGVRVRLMVPSSGASDNALVQHASHRRYRALIEAGVEIYEYHRTLLHQKVMTVDGAWSAIGSANFDDRSFEINEEATLGISDPAFARALEEVFERDLVHARRIRSEEWARRGKLHKLGDAAAWLLKEQL
ncbi:MAG TPA: phospholipase D-like domain-containing protein [Planctomycetota bacterium]|nr:phospholipase D-like domain-containing protein [Planctomycetota bacterium]